MTTTTLAVSGYAVKPYAVKHRIWHAGIVPTPLEMLFAERLKEEMDERDLSANALAKAAKARGFKLGQTSVSRILDGKQSATVEKLYEISETLGLPAWYLLTKKDQVQQRVISPPVEKSLQRKVLELPRPYPKIFTKKPLSQNGNLRGKKTASKK
jgi:transcriptional regulator with XRE-family HTH domain